MIKIFSVISEALEQTVDMLCGSIRLKPLPTFLAGGKRKAEGKWGGDCLVASSGTREVTPHSKLKLLPGSMRRLTPLSLPSCRCLRTLWLPRKARRGFLRVHGFRSRDSLEHVACGLQQVGMLSFLSIESLRPRRLTVRTSLTCRQRRVKCDEGRPICGRCTKASRECAYSQQLGNRPSDNALASGNGSNVTLNPHRTDPIMEGCSSTSSADTIEGQGTENQGHIAGFQALQSLSEDLGPVIGITASNQDTFLDDGTYSNGTPFADFDASSFKFASAVSPGTAPFQWYDLLAQDALDNFDKHSFLNHDTQWEFDPKSLSRRPSVFQAVPDNLVDNLIGSSTTAASGNNNANEQQGTKADPKFDDPWNTQEPIVLQGEETLYLQVYIRDVAPILDLFDPAKHFGNIVPHLALRNLGLMKALLAVAARYVSLNMSDAVDIDISTPGTVSGLVNSQKHHRQAAAQYYYETLGYLARAMQLPSYTRSSEILATAIMISTYEMFDGSRDEWERHLRGAFWIQRSQDNDGESRGIREAVWWAWVRQDIWAALRERRRTLTIWRPKKPLSSLSANELATRVVYLLAKAICYASREAVESQDLGKRLEEGNNLLQTLEDWFAALPRSYDPIPNTGDSEQIFEPIWIHPPSHAAAIQTYCLAKILISLNKPSAGSVSAYHECQNVLRDASRTICGLAKAPHSADPASAFVSFQCLFGGEHKCILFRILLIDAAGQCLRTVTQQEAFIEILQSSIDNCKVAPKSLIGDLRAMWKEYT